jgi:transcription antitermination factor NusG
MWRILMVTTGSLVQVADVLTFFGVAPGDIFAPYIVRRVPNKRARPICQKTGKRRRYVQPMREQKAAMFPGYLFVRCASPVACGVVDWAARGRGALLRSSIAAEPSVISGDWIDALRGLCVRDDKGRMCVADNSLREEWRGAPDALAKAMASGAAVRVRMVAGVFEGLHAEIEPLLSPEAVAAAMKELDESGRVRVCFEMFGSRRSIDVPREQVDLAGDCMPAVA